MALFAQCESVPEDTFDMGDTSFRTKVVYGGSSSVMIATRPAGYHSRPHTHDCEQLNWVRDGELWVFIGDRAFHLYSGDSTRAGPVTFSQPLSLRFHKLPGY
jgi:mannose-6-phosphate isomerase-like protein (cupin superfamily)